MVFIIMFIRILLQLQTTYSPGENDILTKEVTLTIAASNGTVCPESIDEMTLTILCTDINNIVETGQILLYPNPNDGSFNLKVENTVNESINIIIYNSIGKEVYNEKNISMYNNFNMVLSLDQVPGIYTIILDGNKTQLSKKFIIK